MNTESKEIPPSGLNLQSHGLSEKLDHQGIWFESKNADTQIGFLRHTLEAERRLPTVYEAIDFTSSELKDIKTQVESHNNDRKRFKKAVDEIRAVQNTLLGIASHDMDTIDDSERDLVKKYFTRHAQRQRIIAEDPTTDEAAREDARRNQEIFATLPDALFAQYDQRQGAYGDYVDEGVEKANTYADTHEVRDDELELKDDLLFPEYEYKPDKASEVLASLRDKDNITFDDINAFYEAAEDDILQQLEQIEAADLHGGDDNPYAGWKDRVTAIGAARHFFSQHKDDEDVNKKRILVSIEPNESIHVGFALTSKNPEGTRNFSYSLDPDTEDFDHFNIYAENVDQYYNRLMDNNKARETLSKLKSGDTEFLHKLEACDDDAVDDFLSTLRIPADHKSFINNDEKESITDDEYKDIETLEKFETLIISKAQMDWMF